MAHFVFQRPGGDWSAVVTPLGAWFTGFDQQLFKAINGDDGGSWAPLIAITIGGAGIDITGPASLAQVDIGDGTVNGTLTVDGGAFNVQGGATFNVKTGTDAIWETGSTITFQSGAGVNFLSGAVVAWQNGSSLATGATATVTHNGTITVAGQIDHVETHTKYIRVYRYKDADYVEGSVGGIVTLTTNVTKLRGIIEVPQGATLLAVFCTTDPNGGHVALPASMPMIQAFKLVPSSGAVTQLGATSTDPSGLVSTYEARHSFSISGIADVVDNSTTIYWVDFASEGSTNAVSGAQVWLAVQFTTAKFDSAAA